MDTSVLYTTLVCLAIVGGMKGEIVRTGVRMNKKHMGSENDILTQIFWPNSLVVSKNTPESEILFNEYMKRKCWKNSEWEHAFDMLRKEMSGVYRCWNARGASKLMQQHQGKYIIENNETSLKTLCNKLPEWHLCEQNYMNILNECFDDNEKELFSIFINMRSDIEPFLCRNDGERLLVLFSEDGVNCFINRQFALGKCWESLMSKKYFSTFKEYSSSTDSFLSHYKFNEERCTDLHEFKFCVVDELKQCNQPTISNLVDTLLEMSLQNTPCIRFDV